MRHDHSTLANPSKASVEFGGTLLCTACLASTRGPAFVDACDLLYRMPRASGCRESFWSKIPERKRLVGSGDDMAEPVELYTTAGCSYGAREDLDWRSWPAVTARCQ